MDVRTNLYNIRDIFYIVAGFLQSLWLILRVRPDVVFAKGGYVCLPLGFAAHFLGCKLVIHDSDTRPGLTNRILARFADAIATGSPLENYSYPKAKSSFTGVPIDTAFHPFSASEQRAAKDAIGVVDVDKPLVVVTGGGLGAKSINDAMVRVGRVLIEKGIQVYHIAGKKHYEFVSAHVPDHPHYQVVPFVYKDMVSVLGAADLVVARASATFLQELAGLKKATIVIPAAQLGDQIKNAHMYQAAHATYVLTDAQLAESDILGSEIMRLLNHSKERQQLAENLYTFAKPEAAADLAKIIRNVIKRG